MMNPMGLESGRFELGLESYAQNTPMYLLLPAFLELFRFSWVNFFFIYFFTKNLTNNHKTPIIHKITK